MGIAPGRLFHLDGAPPDCCQTEGTIITDPDSRCTETPRDYYTVYMATFGLVGTLA